MAGLDNLEIVVDVVDSFSDEINELLHDLEAVDIQTERVDDILLDATNLAGDEIEQLRTQLESLTDETVVVEADVDGRGELISFNALKEAVATDEISNIDFEERGLDQIIAKLAVANSETMALQALSGDIAFGGGDMGRVGGEAQGGNPGGLALRMSDLHNILASLIPMLLVYVGALPAVIGGVVALGAAAVSAAAALAALTGLGALGFALVEGEGDAMEGLSEIAERVQSDFMDAFEPLARDLAPLFEEGLAGLERFFDSLASHGDILRGLQDEARAAGAWMAEFAVGSAASMGKLAEAAAPLFGIFAQIIEDMDLLEGAAGFLAETLPALMAFGAALGDIIVNLMQMGVGFLTVATYITQFLDGLLLLLSGFGMFEEQIGAGIGALLGLLTLSSLLYNLWLSKLLPMLFKLGVALFNFATAESIAATQGMGLIATIKALELSMWQMAAAASVATFGLAAIVGLAGAAATRFLDTSSAIDEATKSLEDFQSVQGDLDGTGGAGSNVFQFNPTSRRTVINAPDTQTARRVSKYEEFKNDDFSVRR